MGDSFRSESVWGRQALYGLGAAALLFVNLAACDGAPSAVPARAHAAGDASDRRLADATADDVGSQRSGGEDRPRGSSRSARADTPLYRGKPLWAANRNHSA